MSISSLRPNEMCVLTHRWFQVSLSFPLSISLDLAGLGREAHISCLDFGEQKLKCDANVVVQLDR